MGLLTLLSKTVAVAAGANDKPTTVLANLIVADLLSFTEPHVHSAACHSGDAWKVWTKKVMLAGIWRDPANYKSFIDTSGYGSLSIYESAVKAGRHQLYGVAFDKNEEQLILLGVAKFFDLMKKRAENQRVFDNQQAAATAIANWMGVEA